MPEPLRVGFLTHLRRSDNAQRAYAEALALFEAADRMGLDSGWVAQHHFGQQGGLLPSPLPFLAAAAARTRQIRLGTSIVVIPLESPLRVAEDAAVVDLISAGRLELGVGSGGDPGEFQTFGVALESRHSQTTEGLIRLKAAFRGERLSEGGQKLQPPAPTLLNRMWLSALSTRGAAYAAQHEVGLMLSRAAWGHQKPTDEAQVPVAQAYLDRWDLAHRPPRIALSRGVYVASDRPTALAEMQEDVMLAVDGMVKQGRMAPDLTLERYCELFHIAYGDPQEVVASLLADRVLPAATDLILQLDPVFPTLARTLQIFEQIASELAQHRK